MRFIAFAWVEVIVFYMAIKFWQVSLTGKPNTTVLHVMSKSNPKNCKQKPTGINIVIK